MAKPSAMRTKSAGVSYAVQIVSFCGMLTRTVTTNKQTMKVARNVVPSTRSVGERSDAGFSDCEGLCGRALSTWIEDTMFSPPFRHH